MCEKVRGFEMLTSQDNLGVIEEEFKALVLNDISLKTVKLAIDAGCFTNFEEFEFAVFRLMEQS